MGKHTPNTCEVSKIHTSKTEPKEHVDMLHFGADGKKDNNLTKQNSHLTDKNYLKLSKMTYKK